MIDTFVRLVYEGDISAIIPLLDELGPDDRAGRLLQMVRDLTEEAHVIAENTKKATPSEWDLFIRERRAWERFRRAFKGVFWRELDGRLLIDIIKDLQVSFDTKKLMDATNYERMMEARRSWSRDIESFPPAEDGGEETSEKEDSE